MHVLSSHLHCQGLSLLVVGMLQVWYLDAELSIDVLIGVLIRMLIQNNICVKMAFMSSKRHHICV